MPFKSKDFDKYYPRSLFPDVSNDMLGLNLRLDQYFYTRFFEYKLSPFDYIPFTFSFKIGKLKVGDMALRFDFYRLGMQEFLWNPTGDCLPEHDIHYRGTELETMISLK